VYQWYLNLVTKVRSNLEVKRDVGVGDGKDGAGSDWSSMGDRGQVLDLLGLEVTKVMA
jgi:hypothetical protein